MNYEKEHNKIFDYINIISYIFIGLVIIALIIDMIFDFGYTQYILELLDKLK